VYYIKNFIITDLHRDSPAQLAVRVGSNQYASGGQLLTVSRLIPHPKYDNSSYDNDIAIIELATPITFGPNVSPVTLPASGTDPADGTVVTAIGWGRTSTNGPFSADMQKVTLTINRRSQCQSIWGAGATITNNMICAGGNQTGQGICDVSTT